MKLGFTLADIEEDKNVRRVRRQDVGKKRRSEGKLKAWDSER